ncbi:hypothetical protein niasHT_023949 [Heterodera trifolii]|uniref:polynucleotide adenylyltransferase n=1 Tax=Heterodera trifolii TaxID=157864 RepID=A0ABD2JVF7_9BILA
MTVPKITEKEKKSKKNTVDEVTVTKTDEILTNVKAPNEISRMRRKSSFVAKRGKNTRKPVELRLSTLSKGQTIDSLTEEIIYNPEGQIADSLSGQIIDSPKRQMGANRKGQIGDSPKGQIADSLSGQIIDSPKGQKDASRKGQIIDSTKGQMGDSRKGQMGDSPKGQMNDSRKGQIIDSPKRQMCANQKEQIIDSPKGQMGDTSIGQITDRSKELKLGSPKEQFKQRRIKSKGQKAYSPTGQMNDELQFKWHTFKCRTAESEKEPQFLLEKLFFVQNNLDDFALGSANSKRCMEQSAVALLDSVKLRRVGKNVEAEVTEDAFFDGNLIYSMIDQSAVPSATDDDASSSLSLGTSSSCSSSFSVEFGAKKVTQFGTYELATLITLLGQLHTQIFATLFAKNLAKIELGDGCCSGGEAEEEEEQQNANNFWQFETLSNDEDLNLNTDQQLFTQNVQAMKIVVEQQKLIDPLLLTNGSYMMNAELDSSDLDLLCIVPAQINLNNFLYQPNISFFSMLKKNLTKAKVSSVSGRVPLIRIEQDQIEFDVLFVPVPLQYLAEGANLESDQLIRELGTAEAIYSLAGYRSGKFQLSLVKDRETFSQFLKAIKLWAKNRLIYSGLFGYFNGATLSVMATKICALFPYAPLAYLLYQFFTIYSNWNWASEPVMIEKLSEFPPQSSLKPPKIGENSMTVITPRFPEQNASFNVNKFTLRTIVEEIGIANKILTENPSKWAQIFEEINFMNKLAHFALIWCADINQERYITNCGFHKCKIRRNLLEWATTAQVTEQLAQYQLIPQSEQKGTCKIMRH